MSHRELPPVRRGDRFLSILALGLGTGYFPKSPGTAGSLLGPPLVWGLGLDGSQPLAMILTGILFFVIGIPICAAGSRFLQLKDPGPVVFDEIAAFFWVFLWTPITPATAVIGFLLFRLFDIAKPWPVRRLERLPGGLGIMADDAAAGFMAGGCLWLAWRFFLFP